MTPIFFFSQNALCPPGPPSLPFYSHHPRLNVRLSAPVKMADRPGNSLCPLAIFQLHRVFLNPPPVLRSLDATSLQSVCFAEALAGNEAFTAALLQLYGGRVRFSLSRQGLWVSLPVLRLTAAFWGGDTRFGFIEQKVFSFLLPRRDPRY